MGSGKSELLAYIEQQYKAVVLRSDEAVHVLYQPGSAVFEEVRTLLEKYRRDDAESEKEPTDHSLLLPDGSFNRKEIAYRMFGNEELRQKMNAILHPAVRVYILDQMEKARAEGVWDYFFLESAILIEADYERVVDEIWYVYAKRTVRISRLKAGRSYTDEKIKEIMKAQLTDKEFRAHADVIIDNSGSLEDAFFQIDRKLH